MKKVDKKAQIQQVFTYIMAMLVIGLLVLVGFKMVHNLLDKQCQVQETTFKNDLIKTLSTSTRYGSVEHIKLIAPCNYEKVCFVETEVIGSSEDTYTYNSLSDGEDYDPIIATSIKGGVEKNVFLKEKGTDGLTIPIMYDENIKVAEEDGVVECVERAAGSFSFWAQGLGKEGLMIKSKVNEEEVE